MIIFKSQTNSLTDSIVALLILAFPALLMTVPDGGSGAIIILVLVSIVSLSRQRQKRKHLNLAERNFLLAVAFFLLVYVINISLLGSSFSRFDNASRFMLLLPILFYLRKNKLPVDYFFYSLFAGTMACAAIAIYQVAVVGLARADGITNAVPFGGLSITMAMMCLAVALISTARPLKVLMAAGFACGLLASILSGTRGAWLVIPICLLVLLVINPGNWGKKARVIIVVILMLAGCAAYTIPAVQVRLDTAQREFIAYSTDFSDKTVNTSVGLRLETWRASAIAIKNNPILGIGEGNFHIAMRQLVAEGRVAPILAEKIAHVHNEFISTALHRGLFGLVSLLLIFFLPLVNFIKLVKAERGSPQLLAASGVMLVISSMTLSLSDVFFCHHNATLFYVANVYIIYGLSFLNISHYQVAASHKKSTYS